MKNISIVIFIFSSLLFHPFLSAHAGIGISVYNYIYESNLSDRILFIEQGNILFTDNRESLRKGRDTYYKTRNIYGITGYMSAKGMNLIDPDLISGSFCVVSSRKAEKDNKSFFPREMYKCEFENDNLRIYYPVPKYNYAEGKYDISESILYLTDQSDIDNFNLIDKDIISNSDYMEWTEEVGEQKLKTFGGNIDIEIIIDEIEKTQAAGKLSLDIKIMNVLGINVGAEKSFDDSTKTTIKTRFSDPDNYHDLKYWTLKDFSGKAFLNIVEEKIYSAKGKNLTKEYKFTAKGGPGYEFKDGDCRIDINNVFVEKYNLKSGGEKPIKIEKLEDFMLFKNCFKSHYSSIPYQFKDYIFGLIVNRCTSL